MWASIKYNLAHLTDFKGRDARPTFWWYILFIVVLQVVIGIVAAIPLAADAVGQTMDAARAGATESEIQARVLANMGSGLKTQALVSVVLSLVSIALVAASFVRRLHDAGYTGLIALIPIATRLLADLYNYANIDNVLAAMSDAVASGDAEAVAALQGDTAWASLVGWVGILVFIGFGILKSQDGPNKYGEGPARA